ncbi:hypothetical protein C8R47DRAFT_131106 [Mycena vitilis]|nr:hypothetical protein C8R47DRAFT_131106 [Mycena vitilis]
MYSPFAAQLGTNYCPKDEELPQIKALLVEPSLRLKRFDDEIAELQKAMNRLAEERDSLRLWMDAHRALISPARRLPMDIVQEIFIACLPTHRNCVMSGSEAPVLLGRICSSWRTISLSTPRLWARLHVVEPPSFYGPDNAHLYEAKLAQRLETTRMWLGRSGQCPLSISLLGFPEHSDLSAHTRTRLLEALISFAARWQHISFNIQPVVLDVISRLAETDVPHLESVIFRHDYPFPPRSVEMKDFGILRAPLLTSFSASGDCFLGPLPLRWDQLRFLEINSPTQWGTSITSANIMQTISMCPQLRACKLTSNNISDAQIESFPPVQLKSLHTFELGWNQSSTRTLLLDGLFLPVLRNFTLRGPLDLLLPPSMARFFALWTKLESLEIESGSFSKSSLLDSLRALPPSLRRLSIQDYIRSPQDIVEPSLDDDTLAVLTSDRIVPCPALHTLHIEDCSLISDAALQEFIIARMDQVRPTLKRVDVRFNRTMTLDILPNLLPFIEKGLDVSLTYIPPFSTRSSPWQGLPDAPLPVPPHS